METFEQQVYKDLKIDTLTLENVQFIECCFEGCTFNQVQLSNVRMLQCEFRNCTITNPVSQQSDVQICIFDQCNLIGVSWGMFTSPSNMHPVIDRMKDCYLKYTAFTNMKLSKQRFDSNHFSETTFESCNLQHGSFRGCHLEATRFHACDLSYCDFQDAVGFMIDIQNNQMKHAKFSAYEAITLLEQLGITII